MRTLIITKSGDAQEMAKDIKYYFILFYFICHTNYKKYRKRRKKKRSGEET